MEAECLGIRKNALQLSWYMRGGISYTDILNLSPPERNMLSEIVETNLEVTKKTKLNFF